MKSPVRVGRTRVDVADEQASMSLSMRLAMMAGWTAAIVLFVAGSFGGHLVLSLVSVLVFSGLLFLESSGSSTGPQASLVQLARPGQPQGSVQSRRLAVLADARVEDAASAVLASQQPDFAVVRGETVLGVVTRWDIIWALVQGAGEATVISIARQDVPRVDADRSFDEVGRMMAEKNMPIVAVFDGESYLGLVKHSDIAEALTVPRFTTGSRPHGVTPSLLTRKAWT